MCYDSVRRRVVMFDGGSSTTWEWDGNDWADVSPTGSPGAGDGFGMAFDPARGRTVLFGGFRLLANRFSVLCLLVSCAGALRAQDPPWTFRDPEQEEAARAFRIDGLQAADPVAVAWAAHRAGALTDRAAIDAALPVLREALGRLRMQRTESAELAALQILHALVVHRADLPAGELAFRADGLAFAARVALLLRSSDPRSRELLCDEFEQIDPVADAIHEAIGDHLVARRHPRAARAVAAAFEPRLFVFVGRSADHWQSLGEGRPLCFPGGVPRFAGQPPLPFHRWQKTGPFEAPRFSGAVFLPARLQGEIRIRARFVSCTAPDYARARWVLALAGVPSGECRDLLVVELAAPATAGEARVVAAAVTAARVRLQAALDRAHGLLVGQGLAPATAAWTLGDEQVRLVDLRDREQREALPLPESPR